MRTVLASLVIWLAKIEARGVEIVIDKCLFDSAIESASSA